MSAKTISSPVPLWRPTVAGYRRRPEKAAFTLLELLLVATILAVMAGAMAPRMNGAYRGLQFRGEIHQVTSLINYASEMAIRSRSEIELRFVQGGERMWLEGTDMERFGAQRSPYYHAGRAVTIRSERQALQNGQPVAIQFFPDGSRTEDLLTLRDGSGRMRWIEIGRSLSELDVSREEPTEVQP